MAKQDEYTRITLRLPSELHEKLTAAAEANSLNAEIVQRLEMSFQTNQARDIFEATKQLHEKLISELEETRKDNERLRNHLNISAKIAEDYQSQYYEERNMRLTAEMLLDEAENKDE